MDTLGKTPETLESVRISLEDELEPYWEELDGFVQEKIRSIVKPSHFKYFEACIFKLKALWYIHSRVEDLDVKYGNLVDTFLDQKLFDRFVKDSDGTFSYFPFFEALEFENLLNQGKACLDCFAKAAGSTFGDSPNNISKLESVLKPRRSQIASQLLHKIEVSKRHLDGILLDPKKGKKSIRDLVSHREHASIRFRIDAAGRSRHAIVRSDHPEVVRLSNYHVTEISTRVWYHTRQLVAESLPLFFERV